jgi:amino acid transporter
LAASVIELSSRYPQEGGLYVWTREAFGDFSGFIAAWTYWVSNLPYFPGVLYFGAGSVLFAFGSRGQSLAANACLAIITSLNIVGVNAGKWLNNIGAAGSIVPLATLIVLAAVSAARFGSATHFSRTNLVPHLSLRNAIFWATIFFAFGGCEAGSFMGEEIRNPRRTIPRALLVGGTVLAAGYIAGTVALLLALPSEAVGGPDGFVLGLQALCLRQGLARFLAPLALLVGLNAVGGAAAFLSSTSRLPFVAGVDHYLPPVFGRIHQRFRTPWVAIGVYGMASMIIALLSQAGTTVRGAYAVLVSMSIIAYFLPYLFLFASMIRLQSRPAPPEALQVPGGRHVAVALAAIGFACTALTIVLSVIPPNEEPHKALAVAKVLTSTAALIGAGVAVFASAWRKRKIRLSPTAL